VIFGNNAEGQAEVKSTQVFTTVHEILWLRRKAASKDQLFQLVQMLDVDMLFPACLLGCLQKRFLGSLVFSLQLVMGTATPFMNKP
jgi:hypothetical protein